MPAKQDVSILGQRIPPAERHGIPHDLRLGHTYNICRTCSSLPIGRVQRRDVPRARPGQCKVVRPYWPGSASYINLGGACSGQLPQYAAQLNGQNGYVDIPNTQSLNLGNSFTITMWVYLNGAAPSSTTRGYLARIITPFHQFKDICYGRPAEQEMPILAYVMGQRRDRVGYLIFMPPLTRASGTSWRVLSISRPSPFT